MTHARECELPSFTHIRRHRHTNTEEDLYLRHAALIFHFVYTIKNLSIYLFSMK